MDVARPGGVTGFADRNENEDDVDIDNDDDDDDHGDNEEGNMMVTTGFPRSLLSNRRRPR